MRIKDKNLEQRINSLSGAKAELLEKLLQEQRKKKQAFLQHNSTNSRIQKRRKDTKIPCSYMQMKFWYVEQIAKNSIPYNMSGFVRFTGRLDTSCLKTAFGEVIKRHEALRSCFVEEKGTVAVKLIDIIIDDVYSEKICTDKFYSESERIDMMIEEGSRPFDLSKGNLIRLTCYKFSDTDWIGQITWHHIVSDGYSSGIFIREILSIYVQLAANCYKGVSGPEIQYYDYVIYANTQLAENKYDAQLRYWINTLSGSAMKCEIPNDYPADHVITYRGDRVNFTINQEIKLKIEDIAKKYNVTKFCILMSALKIMLHKYVAQDDIIVGTPVIGRNMEECQDLIGCFVNMLPIRSVIDNETKVSDFILAESTNILNALNNQDIPFDYIVEQMKVDKDIYSTPIYQVVFSYEGNAIKEISVKDMQIEFSELNLKTAKVDLALEINDAENGYEAWFEYKSNKFSRERIEKIAAYYMKVLAELISHADKKICEIEMITEREKNMILNVFNKPISASYEPKTISAIFEDVVCQYPNKTAVKCRDISLTYKELNEKANQVARYLAKRGVSRETIVAVMLEKSIEAFIALLGVSKAGGAYLPLDLSYPKERISYILSDSKAAFVIVDNQNTNTSENVECIDINDERIASESKENLGISSDYNNLAYIIYTSGTTGKPKGVMVEHTGIRNLKEYFINEYNVTKDDVILQFANLVFDASIWEFVMGLLTGATLCIFTKEIILDTDKFIEALESNRVTVATLPPQYWTMIQDKKPNLRVLITAGSEANVNMLKDLNESITYYNAYGPTETTVCATDWRYDRNKPLPGSIPIGTPISNMQVYIMNHNTLCGIDCVGELCIAGVGVARGYINNEKLSNEKYQKNPFGEGKIYRTGDYASWTKDGDIIFHGRIDNQVKINGYRIELGEIENAIHELAQVRDAVVITESDAGDKSLAAYIIADDSLTLNEIRTKLLKKLPGYMIPANFYKVSYIPLNVNGKVDKQRLKSIGDKMMQESTYVGPTNETEKILADIWCEYLGLEKVSITDNIFEIGGDSIICMQIISKAAERGMKIELRSFYDDKCICEMAKHVVMNDFTTDEQGVISGELSLTPIQQWFINHNFEQENYWNQSVVLEVKDLQVECLNKALNEVRKQHDMLRAKLIKDQGSFKLAIQKYEEKELVTVVTAADKSDEEYAIKKLQQSLDIYEDDVFKALLLITDKGSKLVMTAHHLVCDAVSYRYITEDLFNFYRNLIQEKEIKYPIKTNSFLYWERELSNYLRKDSTLSKLKWWKSQNLNMLRRLPKDFLEGSNLEQDAVTIAHKFTPEDTARLLKDVPKNYKISTIELLIACLAMVLYEWDNKTHLIYMESHGRDVLTETVNVERTVGWFTQIYPFVLEIKEGLSLNDILMKCKDTLAQVEEHKTEYLVLSNNEFASYQEVERNSLIFNYLGQLDNVVGGSSDFTILRSDELLPRGGINHRPFLLDITAYILNGQLIIELCYSNKIYKDSTVNNLLTKFSDKILESADYCINTDAYGLSASDFSDVDMEDLGFILSKFN
jgi:amino acid adenylation domain-containing protein/non-ribosomal peptide synthase protein (TIGR01720 family)